MLRHVNSHGAEPVHRIHRSIAGRSFFAFFLFSPRLCRRNLVIRAGKSMRSNFASDGTKIIAEATHLVDGLGQQVNGIEEWYGV